MDTNEFEYLTRQLKSLGFPERIAQEADYYMHANASAFHLYYHKEIGEEQLMYDLSVAKKNDHYQLTGYELTLKEVIIPDSNIHGISTKDLDRKLKEVDDWYNKFLNPETEAGMSKQEYDKAVSFISATNNELYRLAEYKQGEETAKLLMFKYHPQNEYEKFFAGYAQLQQQYEHKQSFSVTGDVVLTATDAYRCIKAEVQGSIALNNLPTIKTDVMNEKNFDYLKDQVKFTGFGDALEAELKEKMRKQVPEFQLYHNTKFGNDVATATLHFKKSEQSEMYFFNKYDLTLKLENNPDMLKQTFYINKGNNITLKEGFNLMSGRAVNKDLTNKEGQVYNAWVQMDFKETDKNGNYQLKQYHQNYGFDLAKELSKHPIKELASEQDKARLMESLQRGNRQAVTFIKEGSEQRMYIEANPRFKTLNIYDSSMQRVHSQSQKEKNDPEQSVKQDTKKESRKQGADEEEGFDQPKQKRSRKKGQSIS